MCLKAPIIPQTFGLWRRVAVSKVKKLLEKKEFSPFSKSAMSEFVKKVDDKLLKRMLENLKLR